MTPSSRARGSVRRRLLALAPLTLDLSGTPTEGGAVTVTTTTG